MMRRRGRAKTESKRALARRCSDLGRAVASYAGDKSIPPGARTDGSLDRLMKSGECRFGAVGHGAL